MTESANAQDISIHPVTPEPIQPAESQPSSSRGVWRFLYSQNPFYLLSVCFLLHGTGLWYQANRGTHSPWILMGIIVAYVLMMAGTGFTIVRRGQVWDDARSILLILVALFFILAMTADDVLIGDRPTGRAMLLSAWLVSAAVSEFIFVGLRIRLRALYRLPYHLLLGAIMLFPLVIVQGDYPHQTFKTELTVLLFPVTIALGLIALVPAVRRGPEYVSNNGTPWTWPLFPWSLFVFLTVIAILRSYAISLSFDPVLNVGWRQALALQNSFGGVHLVPIVLAIAVLTLEWSVVTKNTALRVVGLMLPFAAALLTRWQPSALHDVMLRRLSASLVDPYALTGVLCLTVLSYAWWRRIAGAGTAFKLALLAGGFFLPEMLGSFGTHQGRSTLILVAGLLEFLQAALAHQRERLFIGGMLALAGAWRLLPSSLGNQVMLWHLTLALGMSVSWMLNTDFGRLVRGAMGVMLLVSGVACALFDPSIDAGTSELLWWARYAYLLTLVGLCAWSALRSWSSVYVFATVGNGVVTTVCGGFEIVAWILSVRGGLGIVWGSVGLIWFGIGWLISLRKARRASLGHP